MACLVVESLLAETAAYTLAQDGPAWYLNRASAEKQNQDRHTPVRIDTREPLCDTTNRRLSRCDQMTSCFLGLKPMQISLAVPKLWPPLSSPQALLRSRTNDDATSTR